MNQFKIGDKIKLNDSDYDMLWYSTETYTIIDIEYDSNDELTILKLDRKLNNYNSSLVNECYVHIDKQYQREEFLKDLLA